MLYLSLNISENRALSFFYFTSLLHTELKNYSKSANWCLGGECREWRYLISEFMKCRIEQSSIVLNFENLDQALK